MWVSTGYDRPRYDFFRRNSSVTRLKRFVLLKTTWITKPIFIAHAENVLLLHTPLLHWLMSFLYHRTIFGPRGKGYIFKLFFWCTYSYIAWHHSDSWWRWTFKRAVKFIHLIININIIIRCLNRIYHSKYIRIGFQL